MLGKSARHFFGLPGAVLGVLGITILSYLTSLWFLGEPIGSRPLLTLGVLLTLTAAQLLCIGLLEWGRWLLLSLSLCRFFRR